MKVRLATILVVGGVVFGTMMIPTASGQAARVRGLPDCTITGTRGDDRLRGTAERDVICALAGDDFVNGRGGNDLICGSDSGDDIFGGRGDDRILGGGAVDDLRGGAGNDRLRGGAYDDYLYGGFGHDRLFGEGDKLRQDGVYGDRLIGCIQPHPWPLAVGVPLTQVYPQHFPRVRG